jgi:quercetin dioxygenase-like cupin family protein
MNMTTRLWIGAALMLTAIAVPLQQGWAQEKTTTTTILKTDKTATGQPVAFPHHHAAVTASTVVLPAHADTGWHKHPYLRYAYVLEGSITVENDAGDKHNYPTGSFIVEQIDSWHHGLTTEPTKLLVIDQTPAGKGNTVNRVDRGH